MDNDDKHKTYYRCFSLSLGRSALSIPLVAAFTEVTIYVSLCPESLPEYSSKE